MQYANVSTFERDPRRIQELRMRPVADSLYQRILGASDIQRFDGAGERSLLDREHGIDMTLVTPSGLMLTGQEKFLSPRYASFDTLTVEYQQNQHTGEHGDWYKLACQLYFCGYCAPDWKRFTSWVIVNWPAMVLATRRGLVNWRQNHNKDGHAKASFKFVKIDDIPLWCVIQRGKN